MQIALHSLANFTFESYRTIATAILDRLLHHRTPATIMGDSYRHREAKKNKLLMGN